MTVSTFGSRLRAARLAAGLTQQDLAEQCGVHSTTVCRWEGGRPPKDIREVALAAASCGVTFAWLAIGQTRTKARGAAPICAAGTPRPHEPRIRAGGVLSTQESADE